MKKALLFTLILAFLVTISVAFTGIDDPGYKNLKVLPKDITQVQMDSAMHHFSNSLGVKCGFCHVRNATTKEWDYAADDKKHKLRSREMMIMTDSINDRYFDLTGAKRTITTPLMVTCYTCHHGETEPATIAPKQDKDSTRTNR